MHKCAQNTDTRAPRKGYVCELRHTVSVHDRTPESGATRQERKQRTRQALLDAALALLEEQSFSSLSLRQVTREAGIVPTAFYRHFDDMEELGLVLIDESFRTLRAMIRAARADPRTYEHVIRSSVEILVRYIHEHDTHFRFIARERFGGVAVLRHAIRAEIRMFAQHADVVGMTMASECVVAGELGLAYASVCVVDNLANGLAEGPLTWREFEAGRALTQGALAKVLDAIVPSLATQSS